MDILDQAHRLAASGQQRAAVDLVQKAAEAGDAVAQYAVANWRLYGLNGGRDLAEAHRLLDRAIASENTEAVHLKSNLIANGTGVAPNQDAASRLLEMIEGKDPLAARQLELARSATTAAPVAEALSVDPDIRVYREMLSRNECNYLIERAQPELRPSFVVDPSTGGHMPHPTRTSFGMSFDPPAEDLVVRLINQRFATVTGSEIDWGEPLHVLRYAPGQEFRPHFDAIPGAANQRSWTVLTYLNDEYEGGETVFDLLGIRFRGERGDALLFRNADEAGISDSRLRHAGRPVISGIKWLATRWIRTAPHDPWAVAG